MFSNTYDIYTYRIGLDFKCQFNYQYRRPFCLKFHSKSFSGFVPKMNNFQLQTELGMCRLKQKFLALGKPENVQELHQSATDWCREYCEHNVICT